MFGVSFITFALLYLLPADPVRQIAGRSATAETVANIRHELGLDQPFIVQYGRYLAGLVHGDFGRSYLQRSEVATLIAARLPATLLLMAGAITCELALGLTMGLVAALKRGRPTDQALMVGSFVGVSAPQFVTGLLLLYVFAVRLHWFPIGGYGTFAHLVLPSVTLGILGAGWYSRMMRSSMIDVLRQDFIRTARAKGLSRWVVLFRHALPNAILPVIAMVGIDIGLFMSRHRRRGERLRLARHRPARLAGDPARRHPDHHGRHAGLGLRHRARQPSRRSDHPAHRSPDQVPMTGKEMPQ